MEWNSLHTGKYEGMIAETVAVPGHDGKYVNNYFSRPMDQEKHPGIVLITAAPGWDEFCRETARRLTQHGYMVMAPDIFQDFGQGLPGEVVAKSRECGGVSDRSVMDDCAGALSFLRSQPTNNGKVGVMGMCSGGRHTFLAACTVEGFDAAADLWGGGVIMPEDKLTPQKPVSPIEYTERLTCPLLGLFGNEDKNPSPEEVDTLEEALKRNNIEYEFYRYDGASHAFMCYHSPVYRFEQAMDAWEKLFAFFNRHLK